VLFFRIVILLGFQNRLVFVGVMFGYGIIHVLMGNIFIDTPCNSILVLIIMFIFIAFRNRSELIIIPDSLIFGFLETCILRFCAERRSPPWNAHSYTNVSTQVEISAPGRGSPPRNAQSYTNVTTQVEILRRAHIAPCNAQWQVN